MAKLWVGVSAALAMALLPAVAGAAPRDLRAERQRTIDYMLTNEPLGSVTAIRAACVVGRQPALVVSGREAGLYELPDATEYCVAALTRLGRNGALGFVNDTSRATVGAAQAFDNGFVSAYRRREPIPAGLPSMAALKPTAERCLAQAVADTDLCRSVGYAFGVRASQGELVTIQ